MQGCLIFLGTSASMGVPVIGCNCKICLSGSSYNKRKRACVLMEIEGRNFLIDVGPDFRAQALHYGLKALDGLFITHTHYDHIGGLDDLRVFPYAANQTLPCLASEESFKDIKKYCDYLVDIPASLFKFQTLKDKQGILDFEGLQIRYFSYKQRGMQVTGYRFGNLAFMTDIQEYDDSIFETIEGCDTLILSALGWKPTRAHISLEEAIVIANKAKVKKAYLTHIGHELEYEETNQKLPQFIRLAYDGLSIPFKL